MQCCYWCRWRCWGLYACCHASSCTVMHSFHPLHLLRLYPKTIIVWKLNDVLEWCRFSSRALSSGLDWTRAANDPSVFTITEKAPTRDFSWLKAPTGAFTFKTLLRHYAKRALTPRSLNVKLGRRRKGHKGRAAIRHYANQTARPLWPLRCRTNFTLRDRGVKARLA